MEIDQRRFFVAWSGLAAPDESTRLPRIVLLRHHRRNRPAKPKTLKRDPAATAASSKSACGRSRQPSGPIAVENSPYRQETRPWHPPERLPGGLSAIKAGLRRFETGLILTPMTGISGSACPRNSLRSPRAFLRATWQPGRNRRRRLSPKFASGGKSFPLHLSRSTNGPAR